MLNPIEAVLKDISLRYRIPYRVIERIYRCEFELLKKSMINGDKKDKDSLNIIFLRKFGRFVPNYNMIDKIEEIIKKKNENPGV